MSRDIPIIFSAPMIQALLSGRKTMTRRLAWRRPFPIYDDEDGRQAAQSRKKGCKVSGCDDTGNRIAWPPSPWQKLNVGDRLWVREPAVYVIDQGTRKPAKVEGYMADGFTRDPDDSVLGSRPSIHMPRWASRLTLVANDTKIERLTAISEADALAEGVERRGDRDYWAGENRGTDAIGCFSALWMSLHGLGSWDENPEVVAPSFTVFKENIDALEVRAA